jgi:hypothetical protein
MKTEKQHAGEFIATQDADSIAFDTVVLAQGHTVVDGQPLVKSGANIVPADGTTSVDFVGLAIGDHDTTAAAKAVPVAARLIEVDAALLHYPTAASGVVQGDADAAMDAALKAAFIVKR